ncbi:MAG TPA: hypothetical protein VFR00_07045 [Hyphomicrobiaceae bacterium]|jgi:hypothetical protein|nr:hypothetical protein [Hyphomicrobiaceae bacterium]
MQRGVMAVVTAVAIGLALVAGTSDLSLAQQSSVKTVAATAAPKAGKGEKVCRVKLKYSGEVKTWVCKSEEPCCVWHEINYVKCGSTITGCL